MIHDKEIYFEVSSSDDRKPDCDIEFPDIESAIEYAEKNGFDLICEIGRSWDEFKKCWFCEEWKSTSELNRDSLCDHCEAYLISRGEI